MTPEPLPCGQAVASGFPPESADLGAGVQPESQTSAPSDETARSWPATAPFPGPKCNHAPHATREGYCTHGHPWPGFPGPAFRDGHRSQRTPAEVVEAHDGLVADFEEAYGHPPNGIERGALMGVAQAQYVLRFVTANTGTDKLSENADRAAKLIGTMQRLYAMLGLGEHQRQRSPSPYANLTDQELGEKLIVDGEQCYLTGLCLVYFETHTPPWSFGKFWTRQAQMAALARIDQFRLQFSRPQFSGRDVEPTPAASSATPAPVEATAIAVDVEPAWQLEAPEPESEPAPRPPHRAEPAAAPSLPLAIRPAVHVWSAPKEA